MQLRFVEMFTSAFTCTGPYAILILCGIKRVENRSALPVPNEGRAAISCSKSFCKEEYGRFIAWASVNLPPEDFVKLPSWREVKDWPGKIVGVCDYKARARGTHAARSASAPYQAAQRLAEYGSPHHASRQPTNKPTNQPSISWDEGYQYCWDLSNVVRLPDPIPCRGNVGMWQMPPDLADKVSAADRFLRMRIETTEDAYPLFRAAIPIAKDYEGFFVLPIDAERRPISRPILVSLGHMHGTTAVELGEVFREAFKRNANAIIVAHNHPSGDLTPSKADIAATAKLREAADLLGVKFLDHIILGSGDAFLSLAESAE